MVGERDEEEEVSERSEADDRIEKTNGKKHTSNWKDAGL